MRTRINKWNVGGGICQCSGLNSCTTNWYAPSATSFDVCFDQVNPGPPYRRGGPLAITKTRYKSNLSADIFSHRSPNGHYIKGRFYCDFPTDSFPLERSISGLGAEGWAKAAPVSPIMNLGVAVGELKDIPKMLLDAQKLLKRMIDLGLKFSKKPLRVSDLKKAGWKKDAAGHYLNLQFGWIPMLKDLYGALSFQKNLASKLSQLKRDNRRSVRRYRKLRSDVNVSSSTTYAPYKTIKPSQGTFFYVSGANQPLVKTTTVEDNAWFEAKFTYYIPELADPSADLTRLKLNMLGLSLDPVVIYNLVPWTWLLDWFTNTGSLVQNAFYNAKYHVVASYAYVMRSTKTTFHWLGTTEGWHCPTGTAWANRKARRLFASAEKSVEYKRRAVANPYGFGISDASLSPYQWSILVALGLTRRHKETM